VFQFGLPKGFPLLMVLVTTGVTPLPPTGERNWQLCAEAGLAATSRELPAARASRTRRLEAERTR
jgi:hypothetical protein